TGSLTISGGAIGLVNGILAGQGVNDTGSITVTGAGSLLTDVGSTVLGAGVTPLPRTSTRTLTVSDRRVFVTHGDLVAGQKSGNNTGMLSVSGSGSELRSLGTLQVGGSGIGQLDVTAGGHALGNTAMLGGGLGGSGTVTIDGAGSALGTTQ